MRSLPHCSGLTVEVKRQREAVHATGWEDILCMFQKQKECAGSIVTINAEVGEILMHGEHRNLLAVNVFDSEVLFSVSRENKTQGHQIQ